MGLISRVSSRTYRLDRMLLKSSLFLTLAAIATADDDFKREDGVLVLTNDNFADAVAKYKYVLAEFYAPWCGHCKTLAPEYAGAAQALADNEDVALAKIDATVESDLARIRWRTKEGRNCQLH